MLASTGMLAVRLMLKRWERSLLIVACIALGVGTFVSTRMLNRLLETAAAETTTPLGVGDLHITNGEFGVPRELAEKIRQANLPGIKSVQPLVIERITLPKQKNRVVILIGAELAMHQLQDSAGNPLAALEGKNPLQAKFTYLKEFTWLAISQGRRWVVISRALYDDWCQSRATEDAPLVARFGSRVIDCQPVGILDYPEDSPLAALGQYLLGMELGQSIDFTRPGELERVNRIDVILEEGADKASIETRLRSLVGERAVVRTPERQGQSTQEIIGGIQIGFTLCSIGAMVVGLFLVYNALSVTVAERAHDIGVIRALGGTRTQIMLIFTLSALVLGVVGALAGIPLGISITRIALEQIRDDLTSMFLTPEVQMIWPSVNTILIAMLAGILTAWLASIIPSIQAAYQDPIDSVRQTTGVLSTRWTYAHRALCMILVMTGITMVLSREFLPPRVGTFGGMIIALVGMLLSAPIIIGMLLKLLHPLFRSILPIEARLASDNMIRSPGRTGMVIGALGAGVAILIQTAGVGQSNEEPVTAWLEEIVQAEMFVTGSTFTEAMSSQAPLQAKDARAIRQIPGVESVAGIRYVRSEFNNTVIFMVALDTEELVDPSQVRGKDGLPEMSRLLDLRGTQSILISENFALRHGVKPGDSISFPGARGTVQLKIIDAIKDYSWSRGTIYIDRKVYAQLFDDDKIDVFHVFLDRSSPEATAQVKARVQQRAAELGYMTADRVALRKYLAALIERIYKLVNLQQIVVAIVAALGVITSLLISVLQRKRELGLLLAVGATPGQILLTVLSEAVIMGVLGIVLGFLMGIPLEWYVLRIVLFEESGFLFDLIMPWKQTIIISIGSLLVATLAGLFPALSAVRTRITEAINYE